MMHDFSVFVVRDRGFNAEPFVIDFSDSNRGTVLNAVDGQP